MKIYIMADMEGISGIFCAEQTQSSHPLWSEGRRYLTDEVNVAIAGCFEGGATEVTVRDAHAGGTSIQWENLDGRAKLVKGRIYSNRMPGLDGSAGVILLGYHAMAGVAGAIVDHTYDPPIQNRWLNGTKVGEIALDAAIAAEHGVPTLLVSGDDKTCVEAGHFLSDSMTVQVKVGLSRGGGILEPRQRAHDAIRVAVADVVRRSGQFKPRPIKGPVTLRQEFRTEIQAPHMPSRPYYKLIDGRTYEVTGATVEEAFDRC